MKNSALILFLGIFLFSFGFTSCSEKSTDDEQVRLGKPIPAEDLARQINEIQNKYAKGPFKLKVNDYVEFDATYKIELAAPVVAQSTRLEITRRQEDAEVLTLSLKESVTNTEEGTTVIKEEVVNFPKTTAQIMSHKAMGNVQLFNMESKFTHQEAEQSFHDLQIKDIQVKAPKKWRRNNNCDNCELEAVEISYKVALWMNETEFETVQVQEIILKNNPALASTYSSCASQLADFNGQRYYVKQCGTVLRDYSN